MTMQNRFSGLAESQGHFQNESGLEEKRVSLSPPTSRTSIVPRKEDFGSRIRQSPQICFAFHCQASTRSEAGRSSVENSRDIVCPSMPLCDWRLVNCRARARMTRPHRAVVACFRAHWLAPKRSTSANSVQDQSGVRKPCAEHLSQRLLLTEQHRSQPASTWDDARARADIVGETFQPIAQARRRELRLSLPQA